MLNAIRRLLPPGALISVVGLYLGVVLNFAMTIVAARVLGTAAFGHIALGIAMLNLLGVASQVGLSQASSRFIGEYLGRDDKAALRGFVGSAQWVPPATGLAIAGLGVPLMHWVVGDAAARDVLTTALYTVPAFGSLLLTQNIARGFGRMLLATLPVPVMLPGLMLGAFAAGPYAPADAAGFMTWYGAIAALLALMSLVLLNAGRPPRSPAGEVAPAPSHHFRRWWAVSWPMFVTAMGQQFLRRADVLILAAMVAPEALGLYALGARFAQVVAVAKYGVNRYAMPRIARSFAEDDLSAVETAARQATRLVAGATVAVIAVLLIAGRPILAFAGDATGEAFGYMIVLLAGLALASVRSASLQTLQMCGYERTANTIVLISSPLLLAVGGIAAARFGAMGMAVAVALLTAWQYWFAAFKVRQLAGVSMAILLPPGRRANDEER